MSRSWCRLLSLVLLLPSGCVAPEEAPLDPAALARGVESRVPTRELAEDTLRIAGIGPLAMAVPVPRPDDPDDPGLWRAAALAFDPDTRALRRVLQAAELAAGGTGIRRVTQLEWENTGSDFGFRENEVKVTFDVLAILGLGPTGAASALKRADALLQLAELESAVWRACFAVDRARIRVGAAATRARIQQELFERASAVRGRVAALRAEGQVPDAEAAAAEALLHGLQSQAAELAAELALRRAELLRVCGLPPGTPALRAVGEPTLERSRSAPLVAADLDAVAMFEVLPRLRVRRLRYALAEAEVRLAAAETWPTLRLGPKWTIEPDRTLTGGVVALELPSPFAGSVHVDAALARRDAAREAVEDELQRALVDQSLARETAATSGARLRHAAQTAARRQRVLVAAAARLEADPAALSGWLDALETAVAAALAHVDAREQFALARVDVEEALGVLAGAGG